MVALLQACVALTAALCWAVLVPRVRIDDDQAPDLAALVSPRSTAAVALVAGAAAQVLWLVPPAHAWLWVPYLGLGAPLVAVDLRTTFLPRRMNGLLLAAMAAGTGPAALAEPRLVLGVALGAAAGFGFFYLVWRITSGLGFGDVRLAVPVGAVAGMGGATGWVLALACGTALGALHGIAHALRLRARRQPPAPFPYGPALWLGPLVAVAALSAG